jgi:hypothetical protein
MAGSPWGVLGRPGIAEERFANANENAEDVEQAGIVTAATAMPRAAPQAAAPADAGSPPWLWVSMPEVNFGSW